MKAAALAVALGLALIGAVAASAQDAPAPSSPATAQEAPPPSDAPVVDMQHFCDRHAGEPERYYPPRAFEGRIHGMAVIDCTLDSDHKAVACQIVDENPPRYSFGEYALRIVCRLRRESARMDAGEATTYERNGVTRTRRTIRWQTEN